MAALGYGGPSPFNLLFKTIHELKHAFLIANIE